MVIALTGKAHAGKDTFAQYLSREHGFIRVAFADPIKDGLIAMLGLTQAHFEPENKNEIIDWIGRSPRQLAQTLGTEWGRTHVHSEIWIRVAHQKIFPLLDAGQDVVITDLRMPNEARYVRQEGGLIAHIKRPCHGLTDATAHHSSESGIEIQEGDIEVFNSGTVGQLWAQAEDVLKICATREFSGA